jgi:putative colanic acid biosynthesis UDP-glucose lipid carrier transferase
MQYPEGYLTRLQLTLKRAFDIAISAITLLLVSPLFFLASLAITLESGGPIFSVTHVYGFNNRHVRLLRFRCRDHRSDTAAGRFLARSGLDQLPILINILRGDTSVVGTHYYPLPSRHLETQAYAALNGFFRPGLFSYGNLRAQADGEFNSIEADLFYIRNWSLLLDAKILFAYLFSRDMSF